jgi:hypothetical protein
MRHQSTRGARSYAYRGDGRHYVIHEVEHLIIVDGTGLAIVRLWEERRKIALKH